MKRKLYYNNICSIIYQIFSILIGLIIPRLILVYYGSNTNGLISSISQMLSVITMLDLGIGAVVQSTLYKPIYDKKEDDVSKIYNASKKYFRIIAYILLFYVLLLILYYIFVKDTLFSNIYTTLLIFSISIGYFAQYLFGINDTLLLNADQKNYICILVNLITSIINAIIMVIMIINQKPIYIVKLVSSLIFLVRPIYLRFYVKKNYNIKKIKNVSLAEIPNKWSGLAQHIADNLTNSIDNILLTIFSNFSILSVYNVYTMPLNAVKI